MRVFKWYHPIAFVGSYNFTKKVEFFDFKAYGFSFDLTTEFYLFNYDYGKGVSLRILGFGFEYCKVFA